MHAQFRSYLGRLVLCAALVPIHLLCAAPPTLSAVPGQGTFPGLSSRPIPFTVSDAETPAADLSVTATSSDPVLLPPAGLVLSGAGSNRSLTITPASGRTGAATVTLVVTDTEGLCASNSFAFDVNYFTAVPSGLPTLSDARASWADFNNDGYPDLTLSGYPNADYPANRIYLFQNQHNGSFTNLYVPVYAEDRNQGYWGDFDRDGFLDLIVSASTNVLYRNDGLGSFIPLANGLPRFATGAAAWGDFDNDGDLDVVTTGTEANGSATRLMRNNGDGTFTDSNIVLPPLYASSANWGDFDNDGDLDLLLTGYWSGCVTKLLRNDGGIFTEVPAGFIGVYYGTATWGDFDNDGFLDVLVTGGNGDLNPVSRVYRNNRNGTFTDINAGLQGVQMSSSAWGDFDNDGYLDIILCGRTTNYSSFTGLYHNNHNATFTLVPAALTNVQHGAVAWADVDLDGDLDLLVAGYGSSWSAPSVQLYRNNAPANTPPAAPPAIAPYLLPNGDIGLYWPAPDDAQTPRSGLCYNLCVGSSPGTADIASPQADLASGLRRLPALTGIHTNGWHIHGLPKGTYYFAVQAIDTALAGSPFCTERSFTVTNTPPQLTAPAEIRSGPSLSVTLAVTVSDAESPAAALTVTAQSSNATFIPPASIAVQGAGADRTVTFSLGPGQIGTDFLRLRVTDPAGLYTEVKVRVVSEFFTTIPLSQSTNFSDLAAVRIGQGSPYGSPAVDLNRDGRLDVLMRGYWWSNNYRIPALVVLSNSGALNFTFNILSNHAVMGGIGYEYRLEDFDRNGTVDILATDDPSLAGTFLLPGDGAGQFGPAQLIAPAFMSLYADLDNDGDLDALAVSSNPVHVDYYQNSGGFLRLKPGPSLLVCDTYQETSSARLSDINRDGFVDFLLAGGGTNSNQNLVVRTLRNSGHGVFSSQLYPILGSQIPHGAYTWDVDEDGDLDVSIPYEVSWVSYTGYALNDGTGRFYFSTDTNNIVPSSFGWDFDNNGLIDRVVDVLVDPTNIVWQTRLWLKTGPGAYSPQNFTMIRPEFVGDFDGDGDLDYMAQTEEKDQYGRITSPMQWRIYRNNSDRTNQLPAAPTGLVASEQSDDRVHFSWNAATDDHTPAHFISYNLRVGTTPGGVDVVAPCSNPINGQRWLVAEGNMSTLRFHDLFGLPPGTYYWSVQAIDGVFAGSPWAPEQSFTVVRPTISQLPDITTPPGVTSLPISFSVTGGSSPVDALTITAVADDSALLPTAGIVIAGSGTTRTLTLTPAAFTGDTDLSVVATDRAGFSSVARCHVRVAWWDQRPMLQAGIQRWEQWRWVDANLDGFLDLLGYVPQGNSAPLSITYSNQRNASFVIVSNTLPLSTSLPVEMGGFPGDNIADALILQSPDSYTSLANVWRGSGSGFDFTPLPVLSNNISLNIFKWADLDNDGLPDLVHFGYNQSLRCARGKPDGSFEYTSLSLPMWTISGLAVADFDGDGDFDLAVSGQAIVPPGNPGTNFNRLYLNQGNWTFTASSAGLPQSAPYKLTVLDLDNDSLPDLILNPSSPSSTNAVRLMRNTGGAFVEVPCSLPTQLDLLSCGDYDNDGDLDLAAVTSSDYPSGGTGVEIPYLAAVFRNDAGTFNRADTGFPWLIGHQAQFADADNDGDLDLILSGEPGWNITGRFLMLNTCPRTNTPPPAPINLARSAAPEAALLQWTPQADAESGTALMYNLRVGTTPGGSQIMSAAADPATGLRRLTGPGNIGYAPRWRLALSDGTYYWSVQAIDSGFAASPFAVESSFTYYHPVISALTNMLMYPGTAPAAQAFTVGDTDSDPNTLTLSALSSNPSLLPSANITFTGSGSNRTVSLVPRPGLGGTSYVSVVVADITGLKATNTFQFEVAYFTDLALNLPGASNYTPSFADYDSDGDMDIYLAGKIYRNDGGLRFTNVATLLAGQRHGVAWADFDRDGDLDLAVAGAFPTKLYRNDGNDTFTDTGLVLPTAGNAGIAWGDFDNDGDPDLLFLCTGQIYRNDGPAGFTPISVGIPAMGESCAAFGDYDNDGFLDLLVSGFQGPSTFLTLVFHNNGDGTFTDIGPGFTGLRGASVAWGDYDGDGFLDILTTGLGTSYQAILYHNHRDGYFTVATNVPGVAFGNAQFVDFDNDGSLDVFLCGYTGMYPNLDYATRVYRYNHDGTFSDANLGLPKSTLAAWGDIDGDSDLDLLLAGETIATYRVLENRCPFPNTRPLPPANLTATLLPDNNVLLSWSPGSDLETTNPAALNYAVRAGAGLGLGLVSPHAGLTGSRLLVERGPFNTNSCFLHDVPRGTWYWSVQSVDSICAGSEFPANGSFTITNARPFISAVANQLTVPGRPTPSLSFTVGDFETPADQLLVSVTSLNTNLVPSSGLLLGGAASNRTLVVSPPSGLSGTAPILLSVIDAGGLVATSRFDVVVESFTEQSLGLPPAALAAWGDFDNDNDLDVGLIYSATSIYRNDQTNFSLTVSNLPYLSNSDLAWVDFNNDNFLDLAENGWASSGYVPATYLFRNNRTNTVTTVSLTGLTNTADGIMAWADYDNDGDLDLLLAGDPDTYHNLSAFTRLYRNDRGTLTNSGIVLPFVVRGAAAWADIDLDGDLDLLLAGQTNSSVASAITKLFRNDGNDTFTEISTPFPGVTDCAVAFGDYNNDGYPDIFIAGMATNSTRIARLYRNNGDATFTLAATNFLGVSSCSVAFADFDADGFLDIAVCGALGQYSGSETSRVYHNNAGTSFTDLGGTLPHTFLANVTWADYDNDGDPDLMVGSKIASNNWNIPNTPPSIPTNLSSTVLGTEVRLAWSPSTDAETTKSAGLTYNLRVGTSPGGADVYNPSSDPLTGYHRLPTFGNAGHAAFWRAANLTNGTYYWSVQAIDPGLKTSAFAPEQTVTISRPFVSALTNRSTFPNQTVGPILFTVSDAETDSSNLVVTATSSDTNLVPLAGLVLSGAGSNCSLTITPATNRSGFATITISALDESGQTGSSTFLLTVERFVEVFSPITPPGPVTWADIDNDGDLDLSIRNLIFRNNGAGSFAVAANISAPIEGSAAWADIDGDSDLDLVTTGSNAARVFRNLGNSVFADISAGLSAPGSYGYAAWGDYDNDGDLDLVIAGANTRVYRNNGDLTFTDIGVGSPLLPVTFAAWGDYDNDGDLDLLLAGNGYLRVYRNDGLSTFTDIGAGFPGVYNGFAAWGDYDNDGKLDFVVTGSTNGAPSGVVTRIYRNMATNFPPSQTFSNIYSIVTPRPVGVWKGTAAWGDYDNDGDLDLLVAGEGTNAVPVAKLYRNDGGTFVDSGWFLPAQANVLAAWGDYDNDGNLDIALSGSSFTKVFKNNTVGATNSPPNAPTALTLTKLANRSVRLTWQPATDPNQATGLTYNLRVGTVPGADNVAPAMSRPDGLRLLPARGNAGNCSTLVLTNVPGGVLYCSVQAVDASFAGSAFSPESSITLPNSAPVANGASVTLSEDTQKSIVLSGSDSDGDRLLYSVTQPPAFGTLTGNPPNVAYRPRLNYFGFDQFTFIATDRATNSQPATVFVTVTPLEDVPVPSLSIKPLPGSGIQLGLNAEPWRTWQVQVSEDLVHWRPWTNVLATNLLMQLVDADAGTWPQHFYRAASITIQPTMSMATRSNGLFAFQLEGEPGRNYQVEVSSNLVTWTTLQNIVLTNSPSRWSDMDCGPCKARFYRIRFLQ